MKGKSGTSLVIGGDGTIGSALAAFIGSQGENVLCTSRRPQSGDLLLDLSADLSAWQPPEGIDTAYFCAAQTSIAACRDDPRGSELVNVHNTMTIARKLSERGVFLVFPSTNLVFDGSLPYRTENDPVRPLNVYGTHKARTERALTALTEKAAVLRMTKVVGSGFGRFADWYSALQSGKKIEVLSDLPFSPVPVPLALKVLHRLATTRSGGIWHLSGSRDITYRDAAHFIAKRLDADPGLVVPTTVEAAGVDRDARPRFATLDMSKLQSEFKIEPPDPWDTLAQAIDQGGRRLDLHTESPVPRDERSLSVRGQRQPPDSFRSNLIRPPYNIH